MESSLEPCVQTAYDDQEAQRYSYAMQLVTSSVMPMVLQTLAELQVFEIIARAGPNAQLSPSEIASQIPTINTTAPNMLDRMLRLLASYSVLTCTVAHGDCNKRLYGLTPIGKYFVPDEDGVSLGPLISLNQDKISMASWYQLKDSIVEGGVPFERVYGTPAFQYLSKDPRFNEVVNKGMIGHSNAMMKRILEHYKGFENLTTLVDVGGGLGINLNRITSKYPTIKGINFDLPNVIKNAPTYTGVEHIEGDMFESVPIGDAIFMKCILHNWSDDQCIKLLKNCYKALPIDGKVIIVESILQVEPYSSASVISTNQMDVIMMAQSSGGKERTEEEFLSLAKAAGFKGIKSKCCVCNFWVIEFYK